MKIQVKAAKTIAGGAPQPFLCDVEDASPVGDGKVFAVHRNVAYPNKAWTLTHIPSQLAILGSLDSKKRARDIAKDLLAAPVDWSHTGGVEAFTPDEKEAILDVLERWGALYGRRKSG